MLKLPGVVGRLLDDRSAVAAAIVALLVPTILIAVGFAVDTGMVQAKAGDLQSAADAGATAGREALDAYTPGNQSAANNAAQTYSNGNVASSLAAADVEQGWWDITKTPKVFGPPVAGQTGALFSNAVRVTTRVDYRPAFRSLLGNDPMKVSKVSTGYKCSNTDYPLTLIPDDATPPDKATVWLSWKTGTYASTTSYYFANPNGRQNPIIKFYSPTDGEDVSFVVTFSNGTKLQMDTYCKGTYLIAPDAFDWKNEKNVTATVKAGSTNNSMDVYPDQSPYPRLISTTGAIYNRDGSTRQLHPALRPDKVKITPYPSASGTQYWASEGNPTPDRRTLLVQ